jgi:hypothetical protein
MKIYRRVAKDAKSRKGEWVIDIILLCFVFLCALRGFAVMNWQLLSFPDDPNNLQCGESGRWSDAPRSIHATFVFQTKFRLERR